MTDAEEIARLAGELGYATPVQAMRARLNVLLPNEHHCIRVAQGETNLHGWIDAELRCTLESGERVEIVGLVIDKPCRGAGIGRMLVADVEQWARQRGFQTIGVRSNILREGSHAFYETLGYARCKTQHVYLKDLNA